MNKLAEKFHDLSYSVDDLESDLDYANDKIADLESEIEGLKDEIRELESRVEN